MADLTGRQRKHLRGLAHGLDPVVHVGGKGLTAAVLEEIDKALGIHELIKIRFLDPDEKKEQAAEIADRLDACLAGIVGHVGIFYRSHPDSDQRRVVLPD